MQLLAKVYTNTGVGVPIVCRWLSVGRIWFLLVEGWLPSQAVSRALWWISTGGVVGCMIDAAGGATDLCGLAQWRSESKQRLHFKDASKISATPNRKQKIE